MAAPVLSHIVALKPKNAMSSAFREELPTLLPLLSALPRLVNEESMQMIDDQWRRLPYASAILSEECKTIFEPDRFWFKVLSSKSEAEVSEFKELASFALGALSIPHSNADCERVFSKVGC